MKTSIHYLAPVFGGLVSLAVAQTSVVPPTAVSAPAPAVAPAIVSAAASIPQTGNARFFELHEKFLARGRSGPIGVLFLGDSITELWGTAPHIWDHYFGKYQPANFGIGGDQTQHVIWRIENGELDGINPKAIVLMIGTNNSAAHTGEQIADGIHKIVGLIRAKLPHTKVLLLAILPRDARRNQDGLITESVIADTAKRVAANNRANALIAKLDDGANIRFLNTNAVFLGRDGRIPWTIMPDQLHLSAAGYQLWAEPIGKALAEMIK